MHLFKESKIKATNFLDQFDQDFNNLSITEYENMQATLKQASAFELPAKNKELKEIEDSFNQFKEIRDELQELNENMNELSSAYEAELSNLYKLLD